MKTFKYKYPKKLMGESAQGYLYRIYKASLTAKEFKAWLETEEALELVCYVQGYKPELCIEELKKLNRRSAERSKKAYARNLTKVSEYAKSISQSLDEQERAGIEKAKKDMVLEAHIPPSFVHVAECDTCGFIPTDLEDTPRVSSCPYCELCVSLGVERDAG